jgi:hypothetical protein
MKIDKDALNKYRFWILLGIFLLLWLIPLCMVSFGVSAADLEKKYNDQKSAVTGINDYKNDSFITELSKKKDVLDQQRQKIWGQEWRTQQDLFIWPANDRVSYRRLMQSAYFGDEPDPNDAANNIRYLREWAANLYPGEAKGQLPEFKFEELAKPAYYLNNDWEGVMHPVTQWDRTKAPTAEEVWYSQEDLIVRREVLGLIQNAIQSVARFHDANQFQRLDTFDADPLAPRQFRSADWLLELKVESTEDKAKLFISPKSTLTNARSDSRPAALTGLHLELRQRDPGKRGVYRSRKELVLKRATPLTYQEKVEFKDLGVPERVELKGFFLGQEASVSVEADAAPSEGKKLPQEPVDIVLVKDDADAPAKDVSPERFRRLRYQNTSWELDLLFELNEQRQWVLRNTSKLTNVHAGRRTLPIFGLELQLAQGDVHKNLLLQGEPLAWGKSVELKDLNIKAPIVLTNGLRATDPIEVRQILNWDDSVLKEQASTNTEAQAAAQSQAELLFWQNSPVKRIDSMELGFYGLSDRVSLLHPNTMKFHPRFKAAVDAAQADSSGGTGDTTPGAPVPGGAAAPGPGPGPGPGGPGDAGGPMGMQTMASNPYLTPVNFFERRRYASVSAPVRRMPVGLVLIIDQAHLQEVLAAFTPSNSRVHFHPMQVIWQHVPGIQPPAQPFQDETTGAPFAGPPLPGGPPLATGSGRMRPGTGDDDTRQPGPGGRGSSGRRMRMGKFDIESPGPGAFGGMGSRGIFPPIGSPFAPGGYGAQITSQTVEEDEDPNLVELQIYGLVSLYERFPPRPEEPAATEGQPAPGAPGAPGTPAPAK